MGMMKPEVVVDSVAQEDVQLYLYVPGQTAPYKYVDVTARVAGFLEKLYFKSGSIVKEGDRLALIEQEQYKIAVEAAQAELANADAREALAKANLERAKQLVESRALSPEEFQQRQAEFDMARAAVATAKASIRQAKLNLTYTEIIAPIPGKTTKNFVDIGNFVSQSNTVSSNSGMNATTPSTKLLSIAQMDPMYIDFSLSDRQLADIKERMGFRDIYDKVLQHAKEQNSNVALEQAPNSQPVDALEKKAANSEQYSKIILASGENNTSQSRIDVSLTTGMDVMSGDFSLTGFVVAMIDNQIDYETGQVTLRGEVRNPLLSVNDNEDYMIYPGQICRVRIPYEKVKGAILVHEESILTDLDTKYVLVIKKEPAVQTDMMGRPILDKETGKPTPLYQKDETGKDVLDASGKPIPVINEVVHRRDIKIGKLLDTQQRIVLDGLEQGETYIVKGVQRARIGIPVNTVALDDFNKRRSLAGGTAHVDEDKLPKTSDKAAMAADDKQPEAANAKSGQEPQKLQKTESN